MSSEEAKAFDIPEEQRRRYIRMDPAKVNITPPAEKAMWFHLASVAIGNGNEMYPEGDRVQAIERWQPPELKHVLTAEVVEAILKDIDAGFDGGYYYSAQPRAGKNGAWHAVMKHCPDFTEQPARKLVYSWVKDGYLVEFDYYNPKGDKRLRVGSVEGKRPPAYSIEPTHGQPVVADRVDSN